MAVLVQIMAWHRPGDKPLSEPMMGKFGDAYMRLSAAMSLNKSLNLQYWSFTRLTWYNSLGRASDQPNVKHVILLVKLHTNITLKNNISCFHLKYLMINEKMLQTLKGWFVDGENAIVKAAMSENLYWLWLCFGLVVLPTDRELSWRWFHSTFPNSWPSAICRLYSIEVCTITFICGSKDTNTQYVYYDSVLCFDM